MRSMETTGNSLELYRYFAASREYGELTKTDGRGNFIPMKSVESARRQPAPLYGTILQGKVRTRLEKYAACVCPFS